ncbi:sigma-70 family RNA polymerase sigma factor (plasmid) [Verrucomicrobiaceae bacterium 227]
MKDKDHDLLRRYAEENDHDAFRALVQLYGPMIHGAALRKVGATDSANDISQEVFITLAKKAAYIGPKVSLAGWLFRVTRTHAIDYLRETSRRKKRETRYSMELTLSAEETFECWEKLSPLIDDILQEIPEKDRDLVLMRYFSNRSNRFVAQSLNISEDAARKRISRAMDLLRIRLSKRGLTMTSATLLATIPAHAAPPLSTSLLNSLSTAAGSSLTSLSLLQGIIIMSTKTKIIAGIVTAAIFTVIVHTSTSNGLPEEAELTTEVVVSVRSPHQADKLNSQSNERSSEADLVPADFIAGINAGEIDFYDLIRASRKHFEKMETKDLIDLHSQSASVENLRFQTQLQAQLMRELAKRLSFDQVFAMVSPQPGAQRNMEIRSIFGGAGMDLKSFSERLALLSGVEAAIASSSYFKDMTKNGLPDLGDLDGIGQMNRYTEQALLTHLRGVRERQLSAEIAGKGGPVGDVAEFTDNLYKGGLISKEALLDSYRSGAGEYFTEDNLKHLLSSDDLSSAKNFSKTIEYHAKILMETNPPEKMGAIIALATSEEAAPNNLVGSAFTSWIQYNASSAVSWYEKERGKMPPQASDKIAAALSSYALKTAEFDTAKEWIENIVDPEAKASAENHLNKLLISRESE